MDTDAIDAARHRADPAADRRGRRRCATSATWRRSSASSSGSAATACSAPTSTPTARTPTATSSTSSRAASGCPTSPTTATRSSPRSARSTSPTSTRLLRRSPSTPTPAGAAATVLAIDTRLAAGHWERAETRDVQKTYNLMTDGRAASSSARPSTGTPTSPTSAAATTTARRGRACGSRRTSRTSRRCSTRSPVEDWREWLLVPRAALGGGVPHRRLRRDQLRLLRPHPQRHPRAAGPLEARRRAGRGRDRRGGRQGVRRPALPAALQGDDGRAGRQPARGLPRVDRRRSTG